jgi:hypothetical protein
VNLLKLNHRLKVRWAQPVISVAVLIVACATGASAQTPIGVVTMVTGNTGIQRGPSSLTPRVGTQLDEGDRVTTGPDGHLAATLSDNSELELAESSTLVLDQMVFGAGGRVSTRLSLALGALRSSVTAAAGGVPKFEVHTPNAVVAVRGTKWSTSYHEGSERPGFASCKRFTDVEVYEGVVDVGSSTTPSAQHQAVSPGYETTVACDAPPLEAGPLGITGAGGIGGFRGVAPGAGGVSPPPGVEPLPIIPRPPPGG